ncbi:MAG: type pilus assembly protein PilN [Acidobacteriota bacterium]|nr:type pilus assembly protein PilN [Acidobacteriota bacterium]MDT5271432.1 type pilus assembly protein PilN [Acidobacteriota bacterium]
MISRLNLASDPFRNRALPWTVAVAISAASLGALILVLGSYNRVHAEADLSEKQVQAMRAQQKELDQQAESIRQNIPAEQRQPLEAARALVSRKGFSWSQLFSDLEGFMPGNVRVARINVREVAQVGDQTRTDLDLTVVGRTSTDVTGMLDEMNRSGTFSAVPVTENQKSGRGESGFEWLLRVSYVQRVRRGGKGAPADPAATARANDTSRDAGERE